MDIRLLRFVKIGITITGLILTGVGSVIGDRITRHENEETLAKLVNKATKE